MKTRSSIRSSSVETPVWGVVPAAGLGARFAGARPKQYEPIGERPILGWSLSALLKVPNLRGLSVALNPSDDRFAELPEASDARVRTCRGGDTRQASVAAALTDLLEAGAEEADRVLVHDAARPGLTAQLVMTLLDTVGDDPNGGLLAMPIGDTVKRASEDGHVEATLPREGLWAAQTPQLFHLGLLLDALETARAESATVTDEASAMEAQGYRPRLVLGSQRNLKVTYPLDSCLLEPLLLDCYG